MSVKKYDLTKKYVLVLTPLILLLLAGCLGQAPEKPADPPDQAAQAEAAARDFFDALHQGDYQNAVELYGGSYDVLTGMNPDLDPEDRSGLLAQGCEFNGLVCMRMGDVLSTERTGEGEYTFTVQFLREDGEVFVLGPCCGEDETSMPPVSEFQVRAARDGSKEFKALDLPPYVP
jgi:hypothetical protein